MISNCYFAYYRRYWDFYKSSPDHGPRDQCQVLWLYYEDLVVDDESKAQQIARLIEFIGVQDVVNSKEDIESIMRNTTVRKMKKQYENAVVKDFVRNGRIGDWQSHLSEEQSQIVDGMLRVNFNGCDNKYMRDLQTQEAYLVGSKSAKL